MVELGERVASANSIGEAIMGPARPKTLGALPSAEPIQAAAAIPFNEYQRAMLGFTEYLEANEIDQPAAKGQMAIAAELPNEAHRAKHRIRAFLDQQRVKAAGQA